MAKVNYQFQKAERERAKLAKKEAKRREEHDRGANQTEMPAAPEPAQVKTSTES